MGVRPSSCQNFEMVPFHVMTSWRDMVGDSRWVIATRNGFEVLRFPVMQSSFSFTYVELLAVPTASLITCYKQPWTFEHGWVCLCREKETWYDVCFGKQLEGQSSRRIYWCKPSLVWWGFCFVTLNKVELRGLPSWGQWWLAVWVYFVACSEHH